MAAKTDLHSAGMFLADEPSQLLALQDALQSGSKTAFLRMFEAVVLARGLDRVAAQAGVDRAALSAALTHPDLPDVSFLVGVVERMAANPADLGATSGVLPDSRPGREVP